MADSHEGKGFNQVEGIVLDAPAAQGNGFDALGITAELRPAAAPPDYFGDLVKLIAARLGVAALDPGDPGQGILLGTAGGVERYSATELVNALCDRLDKADAAIAFIRSGEDPAVY